jgi:hypothetical protein
MAHPQGHLLGSQPSGGGDRVKAILVTVKTLQLGDREASHVAALGALSKANGLPPRWHLTCTACAARWISALQSGHHRLLPGSARPGDRIARALPYWSSTSPATRSCSGCAFGLEDRRLTPAPRRPVAMPSSFSRSIIGRIMPSPTHGDAGSRRGWHRLDDCARATAGQAMPLLQRCTTGGIGRSIT